MRTSPYGTVWRAPYASVWSVSPTTSTSPRLDQDAWARAALVALGRGGTAAVAVEALARELGVTKGSFYWHFGSRDELIDAALGLWEREHTVDVIAEVDAGSGERDPAARLRRLFEAIVGHAAVDHVELLLALSDDERVAPALRRVTERRIDYVAGVYSELGFDAEAARDRAVLAYAAYLGHLQLIRTGLLPAHDEQRLKRHLDAVLDTLLAPAE